MAFVPSKTTKFTELANLFLIDVLSCGLVQQQTLASYEVIGPFVNLEFHLSSETSTRSAHFAHTILGAHLMEHADRHTERVRLVSDYAAPNPFISGDPGVLYMTFVFGYVPDDTALN